jgi:DNA-binding response OmpR family regulator
MSHPILSSVRVLIAEKEFPICRTVASALATIGCDADFAHTSDKAREMLSSEEYQLLILDRALTDNSSLELLSWLRHDMGLQTPVIMLASAPREEQKLEAFELGVDDFIAKPFSPREVTARSLALLRRSTLADAFCFGPFRIDYTARTLFRESQQIHLRPKEFELLAALCRRSGEAVSRDELFRQVWGEKQRARREAIAVAVHSIRRKIEADPDNPLYIRTVPSFGYRLDPGL